MIDLLVSDKGYVFIIYVVEIEGLHSCMAYVQSTNTSFSWQFGIELASPLSENCCHDTSPSNIYIVAWQEIVKPIELVIFRTITGYCRNRMVWSVRFYVWTCFSPFKP